MAGHTWAQNPAIRSSSGNGIATPFSRREAGRKAIVLGGSYLGSREHLAMMCASILVSWEAGEAKCHVSTTTDRCRLPASCKSASCQPAHLGHVRLDPSLIILSLFPAFYGVINVSIKFPGTYVVEASGRT